MENIDLLIKELCSKNHTEAYKTFLFLENESKKSNITYCFFDYFLEMINNESSYIRTRGLLLIVANAKWDTDNKIEMNIDSILSHIVDKKPSVSRNFIQSLPNIIKYKKQLIHRIRAELSNADINIYNDNMKSLVEKDIRNTLSNLE
ncbi:MULTISPECIES: SufBD protein [unclassified Clostridioides]|uniref:SufBD protein n=1 Tax=unclassified Clostridioides TaxID=2635829 RepID=UPI001D0C20C6|nr:SufBD protein [Clostridioides sp. ES-S-0001-02]MCC0653598.1 SufBD protein [Clostridioides sp. ES-S-0001-03]MCC0655345.1 SufBD protein [Clostridioides sp. ES-S-0123-01]MCC0679402.1 SufBD protein [Clostridioides sp. ES-S-0005-03]MCC0696485.1 SufBD protein [Clostridioides sp. ES-S-0048-02]MCC0702439.1 SufBD protein [Clostridioides sp. ES-S-0049-02]MCC0706945.1 SufBD protein [Clostridioides sp. ES-S-0190-01]MCC0764303.1 SufBD protein [Clostridioides sp. ES-S-0006-03]UDN49197.1 SufBD protein 